MRLRREVHAFVHQALPGLLILCGAVAVILVPTLLLIEGDRKNFIREAASACADRGGVQQVAELGRKFYICADGVTSLEIEGE